VAAAVRGLGERAGIALDYLAQSDLDARGPIPLAPYPSYLSVGHDEYWTWEERDASNRSWTRAGAPAFFSGNTSYWQVRFERGGPRDGRGGYKFIRAEPRTPCSAPRASAA